MADFSHAGIDVFTPEQQRYLRRLGDAVNNLGNQTNAAPVGKIPPPQPHTDLQVKGGNGKFAIQITDNSNQYRGNVHSVEYDTSPSFSNPQPVHLGPNKTAMLAIGQGPFYFRSNAQYPTSGPSTYKYHPTPVSAAGTDDPPMPVSQGSGFGSQPYTTPNPPKRS